MFVQWLGNEIDESLASLPSLLTTVPKSDKIKTYVLLTLPMWQCMAIHARSVGHMRGLKNISWQSV